MNSENRRRCFGSKTAHPSRSDQIKFVSAYLTRQYIQAIC
jgi:hypothetical protein